MPLSPLEIKVYSGAICFWRAVISFQNLNAYIILCHNNLVSRLVAQIELYDQRCVLQPFFFLEKKNRMKHENEGVLLEIKYTISYSNQ